MVRLLPPIKNQDAVPKGEALLTYQEVSGIFGVDERTVRRWKDKGKVAYVQVGARTVRFYWPLRAPGRRTTSPG